MLEVYHDHAGFFDYGPKKTYGIHQNVTELQCARPIVMKPFLKWAGNKYSIVNRIKACLPKSQRLIEPFAGSAAVFLNTDYSRYLVADSNQDLIHLYQFLQTEGQDFIDDCERYFIPDNNSEEIFYQSRSLFNTSHDTRVKAILFVYLNKHCFNGLCRYNASGKFNTPFGKYKKPYFPKKEMLYFYQKAQQADFVCSDFVAIMQSAQADDVVYCDPPYVPLSKTANFTSYNTGGFNEQQQLLLASTAEQLAARGVTVIISNHDTEFTQQAYRNAEILRFDVQRMISCKGSDRNKAAEVLAVFGKTIK